MSDIKIILSEIISNFSLLWRVGRFSKKAEVSNNFLGSLWIYVEPLIYSATFFVMLGMGLYHNKIAGQPYLIWLLAGISPWYYIMRSYNGGLTSIKSQLNLLNKTKVPISGAPLLPMIKYFSSYTFMMGFFLIVDMVIYGERPTIYWIQIPYLLLITFLVIFIHNLLNSTLAMLIPDYSKMMNALVRVIFFTSGAVFNVDASGIPYIFSQILKLFPFWYVLNAYRQTFVFNTWIISQKSLTLLFWLLMIAMLLVGARLHVKFRDDFTDML